MAEFDKKRIRKSACTSPPAVWLCSMMMKWCVVWAGAAVGVSVSFEQMGNYSLYCILYKRNQEMDVNAVNAVNVLMVGSGEYTTGTFSVIRLYYF